MFCKLFWKMFYVTVLTLGSNGIFFNLWHSDVAFARISNAKLGETLYQVILSWKKKR